MIDFGRSAHVDAGGGVARCCGGCAAHWNALPSRRADGTGVCPNRLPHVESIGALVALAFKRSGAQNRDQLTAMGDDDARAKLFRLQRNEVLLRR